VLSGAADPARAWAGTAANPRAGSPYAYGNRLKLNPLAVMIFVLFWWFIWGIPGVFLAIPIAATLKVLGDQVPRMATLAELLGE
jgi:AI-2 transport protein TqsA